MLTQLINARILTPQGWLKDGSVLIRDGKILEVTNCDLAVIGAQLIDVKGMHVLPGGVEIHAHGGGGRDFMECTEDAFRGAVQTHMKYGTTSIFPTLSSSTVPMIEQAAETCTRMMAEKTARYWACTLRVIISIWQWQADRCPKTSKIRIPMNISLL